MSDFRGTIHQCECPEVADSRRLGDEIHSRPPNGDVRPTAVIEVRMFQRPLLVKRVFRLNTKISRHCGGAVKVIASIKDPVVIKRIVDYLD